MVCWIDGEPVEEGAIPAVVAVNGAVTITVLLKSYTSSRLVPPQNSEELPAHNVEQPLTPSGARAPPLDN